MWQNNGTGNGQFPNDLNNSPNSFIPSPFGPFPMEGYFSPMQNDLVFDPALVAQFNQSQNQNQGGFMQNGTPVQFPPSAVGFPANPQPLTPRPTSVVLTARAAELKERLMKNNNLKKKSAPVNGTSESVATSSPSTRPYVPGPTAHEEQDLDTMISELSKAVPATNEQAQGTQTSGGGPIVPQNTTISELAGRSPRVQPGDSTGAVKTTTTTDTVADDQDSLDRHVRSRQTSEMSEGEILEDSTGVSTEPSLFNVPMPDIPADKSLHMSLHSRRHSNDKSPVHKPQQDTRHDTRMPQHKTPPRRLHEMSNVVQDERSIVRQDESDARLENVVDRRRVQDEGSVFPGDNRQKTLDRDLAKDRAHNPQYVSDLIPGEVSPMLEQLLRNDTDLRDWLLITGYHDAGYRGTVLGNRRRLWMLEAQRADLLVEMAATEGRPPAPIHNPYMLAPSTAQSNQNPASDQLTLARDLAPTNKRTFSDTLDSRRDSVPGKIARLEDRREGRPRSRDSDSHLWRNDRDSRADDRRHHRSRSRERFGSPRRYGPDRRSPYDTSDRYQEGSKAFHSKHNDATGFSRGRGRGRGRGWHQSYGPSLDFPKGSNGRFLKMGRNSSP